MYFFQKNIMWKFAGKFPEIFHSGKIYVADFYIL